MLAKLSAPAACLACVVLTLVVAPNEISPPTTYGSTSAAANVIDLAAGLALFVAGAAVTVVRPRGSTGGTVIGLGVAWLARDWVGSPSAPATVRSVAMVVAPFLLALTVHLIVAYPTGRVATRAARALVLTAYAATAVFAAGRAMFRDPFRDRYCWNNCEDNVFLIRADARLVDGLDTAWVWAATAIVLLAVCSGIVRLVRSTRVGRRTSGPVILAACLVAIGCGAYVGLLRATPAEDPVIVSFRAVFLATSTALVAVALGVVWSVFRSVRIEHQLAKLAERLGTDPAPGTLAMALAGALGDDELSVAYWLPSSNRYVDAHGEQVDPAPSPGQIVTTITRGGEPIAVVTHDRVLSSPEAIGSAARLAVDNERVRAEIRSQLTDLRLSQSRIVAASDATRRRLERDLHDGAQQRLLAASYELQIACTVAASHHDQYVTDVLAAQSAYVGETLTALRQIAHGIFPETLSESGLEAAVRALVTESPIPIEFGDLSATRQPIEIELAAYLVVRAAVEDAVGRDAACIVVEMRSTGNRLAVVTHAPGAAGSARVAGEVADRVGAVGGNLVVAGDAIEAEFPCES